MDEYKNEQQEQSEYKLSPYRHVNLVVFLLAASVNSLPGQTFSSINSLVQDVFSISRTLVTLNTLLFPVLHPICAFPSSWILDRYGIRVGCSLGAVLTIAGVWMRTLIEPGQPALCLLGSVLAAIGNIFILGCPTMFALNWFGVGSAPKVISVTVLINLLSSGLGASLGGLILSPTAGKNEIIRFLRLQAIIITIPLILLVIFFREKPPTPPSYSAAIKHKPLAEGETKQPYIQTIKNLIKNKAYIKICISMSFGYGSLISFFSILNQCLSILKYGNPGGLTSATILSAMLCGIFSAFLFSYAIRTTQKYRLIIAMCLLGATFNFLLLQIGYLLHIENMVAVFVLSGAAGIFLVPTTSLFAAYAAEAAFPEGQGSVTGYLFATSQTFGFIFGIVFISWMDDVHTWKIAVILMLHTVFFAISFAVNWITPEQLNRSNFQKQQASKVKIESERSGSLIVPLFDEQSDKGLSV